MAKFDVVGLQIQTLRRKTLTATNGSTPIPASKLALPAPIRPSLVRMKRKRTMTPQERREKAFHEAGHAAMVFWRGESLHARRVVLHADRFGGYTGVRVFDLTETDLMILLGGPVAEFLSMGVVAKRAFRFANEYKDSNSDSTRIRALVKLLCGGKDDLMYQFEVQERCRAILQEPRMWTGVCNVAEVLVERGEVAGEDVEQILTDSGAQDMYAELVAAA